MALTDIERVRLKIGDKISIRRERQAGDGVANHFKLRFEPILSNPAPQVWNNDTLLTENTDYTVDYDNGIIAFTPEPQANDKLIFQYYSVIYTDEEIQDYLDRYTSVGLASAHILFSWAADIAKIAKRETLQGGGGLGAVTRDTSVASKELRATAQALLDYEIEHGETLGTEVPAEGLTEVPWTEQVHQDVVSQRFIREN